MNQTVTRKQRRRAQIEGRKLFREALGTTTNVETGLKAGVNKMPLRHRAIAAFRILAGRWT